jgi:two-component system, LytTR family, sensor kinase
MKIWRYIFPGLFGLLNYVTIRLINDTLTDFDFWKRDWTINAIEITSSILVGYILLWTYSRVMRHFEREHLNYKTILKEIFWVWFTTEIVMTVTIIPMAAFTDDGLSDGDTAVIYSIPSLFSIAFYMALRSKKLLKAYVENQLKLERLQNDQLQTELKFLKAQYHPHFLFNALNTVYFQMDESVPAAKKSIEKFSELLRYQLYDQQQTVPISQELDYLKNFIELQRVRSSEKLKLEVRLSADWNGQQVYPLLFLPLVENAFKYVGGNYSIQIDAKPQDKAVYFRVVNDIPSETYSTKPGGIGLENLKRRLELLYPGKHFLKINKTEDSFEAEMKIDLTKIEE